jgi:hypothetical protein
MLEWRMFYRWTTEEVTESSYAAQTKNQVEQKLHSSEVIKQNVCNILTLNKFTSCMEQSYSREAQSQSCHVFRSSPQTIEADVGMPRPLYFTFYPIHFSLIILPFDAILQSELLASSIHGTPRFITLFTKTIH